MLHYVALLGVRDFCLHVSFSIVSPCSAIAAAFAMLVPLGAKDLDSIISRHLKSQSRAVPIANAHIPSSGCRRLNIWLQAWSHIGGHGPNWASTLYYNSMTCSGFEWFAYNGFSITQIVSDSYLISQSIIDRSAFIMHS